jgi:hypothetical protein
MNVPGHHEMVVYAPATKYWLGLTRKRFLIRDSQPLEEAVSLTRVSYRKLCCDLHVERIVLRHHVSTHVKSQIG